jgi:hypothetical protein
MAPKAKTQTRHDTRQDTPFKTNTEAGFTDTGSQNRGDTRRDTLAKG